MNSPICNICLENRNKKIAVENGYNIYHCLFCDTIFVHPIPREDELFAYYKDLFERINFEQYERFSKKVHGAALDYISKNLLPGNALDIGCGYGHFLMDLKNLGWQVTGLDLVPQKNKKSSLSIVKGQIENPPFQNEQFDLITMWWVLEHSRNPLEAMKQARRLITPRGTLFVRVPNMPFIRFAALFRFLDKLFKENLKNPISEKSSVFDLLGPPHHLFGFSQKSLQKLGDIAGFSKMEVVFLEQVLTGHGFRDWLDGSFYQAAKLLHPITGRVLYHDLVVMFKP